MPLDASEAAAKAGAWPTLTDFKGRFVKRTTAETAPRRPRLYCSLSLSRPLSPGLHKCLVCGHVFATKEATVRHARGHFFTRLSCDRCDFVATEGETLRDHMDSVHRRGRVCEVCGLRFRRRREATAHVVRAHDLDVRTDRRFCCLCKEVFYTAEGLARHIFVVHPGRGPFACAACGVRYNREEDRALHILYVHTNYPLDFLQQRFNF
jgi:uncharacterized C2H2 Zn-finger protein